MKKNIILVGALVLGAFTTLQAQEGRVGVNTHEPKTTMDISGKRDAGGNLLITDITGLQAPRLTRKELTDKGNTLYGTDQKGALIYITDISDGDANQFSQREKVTQIGYYYFDGEYWQPFKIEPWNNQETQAGADSNTQDIYQMGRVGIGTTTNDSFGMGKLNVVVTGNETKPLITGIYNKVNGRVDNGVNGFINSVTSNRTSTSNNSTIGITNTLTDNNTNDSHTNGIDNSVMVLKGRTTSNSSTEDLNGINNSVGILPTSGGDYVGTKANGISNSLALTAASTGGNVTINSTTSYSPVSTSKNTLSLSAVSGKTITMNGFDNSVGDFELNANRYSASTGGIVASSLEGIHSRVYFGYGNVSATNVAAVKAHTELVGSGAKAFTNLYGLLVSKAQSGSGAAISNSYGVYIQPYRFTGDTAANAYNLYSEGTTTKNYFQGKVGIGETEPTNKLHVKDTADPLKLEGLQTSSDATDKVLFATTDGVVKQKTLDRVKGVLSTALYAQGTSAASIVAGSRANVPGVTLTVTVPTDVPSQTLMITVVGYAAKTATVGGSGQGVFELYQDTTKISSAYASVATGDGSSTPLVNLPVPATLMKRVTLTPGTYTFKVMFKTWAGNLTVNQNPTVFSGYDNDTECMLTKMSIDVFNN